MSLHEELGPQILGSKKLQPLMDLTFGLKIDPSLEMCFSN